MLSAACLAVPGAAHALQPLGTFLDGAHERNPDAIAARATIKQRGAESQQQLSRLLPSLSARGTYTRNQYEVAITIPNVGSAVIQPKNQLDAFFTLDVPIVDLAQYSRYDASKLQRELSEASRDLTERQLKERVIRAYYNLLGAAALVRSAEASRAASEQNLTVVKERFAAGVVPELDLQRASANLERARQDVAEAELSRTLMARSLETISRVTPEPANEFPSDDLHAEAGLDRWLERGKQNLPELRVAATQTEIAEANARTARRAYLPSLAAQASEHLTNATSFAGRSSIYTLSATASFRFDLATVAQKDAADAQAEVSRAQAEGTRRTAEDAIVEAWNRIAANTAKARAARAQLAATSTAARLASDRYASGAATQLDVTQAQRDVFSAEANRIQSDIDLAESRAVLRLAAGLSSLDSDPTSKPSAERSQP